MVGLLQGRVEVGKLTLYKPVLVLETDADGVPNWEFKPGAGGEQPAGAPSEGLHLAVGQLNIIDGTLSYTYPLTGKTIKAEQVKATASVGSLKGPFSIDGTATVNGVPLSLAVSVHAPRDDGANDARLVVKVPNGQLTFDGRTSAIGPDATISGELQVTTGGLTDFISALVRAIGEPLPAFDTSVVGSFAFDGGIEISPTRLAINDFKASLGNDSAAGTLALTHGKQPSLQGKLSLRQVDLDKWLELLAQPGVFLPKTTPLAPAAKPAAPAATPTAPAKPASQPLLRRLRPSPLRRPPLRRFGQPVAPTAGCRRFRRSSASISISTLPRPPFARARSATSLLRCRSATARSLCRGSRPRCRARWSCRPMRRWTPPARG